MKHTPGPWEFDRPMSGGINISADVSDGTHVFVAFCPIRRLEKDGSISPECCANARLIAAAPELLEALKAILPATMIRVDLLLQARAAIAKAQGADSPGQHEATNAEASA